MKEFKKLKIQDKIATIILYIAGLFALCFIVQSIYLYFNYFSIKVFDINNMSKKEIVSQIFNISLSDETSFLCCDTKESNLYLYIPDIENAETFLTDTLRIENTEKDYILKEFNKIYQQKEVFFSSYFDEYYSGITKNINQAKISFFIKDEKLWCEIEKNNCGKEINYIINKLK